MTVLPSALSDYGDDEDSQIAFAKRHCMFLCMPCSSSSEETTSLWWQSLQSQPNKERWWFRRWKVAREWSEIVAGPKWKTFIRRFKKSNNGFLSSRKHCSFRYDPSSYALNFDDGNAAVDDGYAGFSARFAAVTPLEKEHKHQGSRDEHVTPFSEIED